VLTRWQGSLASAVVTLVAIGLVILDLTDGGFRSWWLGHALTTGTVSGLLVLLLTVLVVDQVVRRRQIRDRWPALTGTSTGRRPAAPRPVIRQGRSTHPLLSTSAQAPTRNLAADRASWLN
jgi:hypothetical protein